MHIIQSLLEYAVKINFNQLGIKLLLFIFSINDSVFIIYLTINIIKQELLNKQ